MAGDTLTQVHLDNNTDDKKRALQVGIGLPTPLGTGNNGKHLGSDGSNYVLVDPPSGNDVGLFQSEFTLNKVTTTLSDQTPQSVNITNRSVQSTHGLSLVSNQIRVTKSGLYLVSYDFLSTKAGDIQLFWKKNGISDIDGSVIRHYPPGGEVRSGMEHTFGIILANGDDLTCFIIAKDTPTGTVPPAPDTFVINTTPTEPEDRELVWTYTSSTPVNAWQVQWTLSARTSWNHWQQVNHGDWRRFLLTIPDNQSIDARVRGINQYGAGPWRQRRQGGATSVQSGTTQSVSGNGTAVITTIEV